MYYTTQQTNYETRPYIPQILCYGQNQDDRERMEKWRKYRDEQRQKNDNRTTLEKILDHAIGENSDKKKEKKH